MLKQNPEILAPVGSEEALVAAVRSGADAVYFGTGECNARRFADRFEGDTLRQAVGYCHARGVKVYITMNTLLWDDELKTAAATVEEIALSGADALIIQDLAVAALAKTVCPDIARHASTQMAVHNLAGVHQLEEMGFSRVVLARELTLEEIRRICTEAKAEIEVFVHGALCMSASGMCYLSASLGERSGNRGTCAQPCRLPFSCNGADYCLSLKDMSHLDHLSELREAGVASFKIEGRMKRPEYVAAAVDAAVRARAGQAYEKDALMNVFSRSGFTDGYLLGRRNHTMFGVRSKEDAESSQKVLAGFRNLYRNERPSVPVSMNLTAREGTPVLLQVTDGMNCVAVPGNPPQKAEKVPVSEDYVKQCLSKTGGTPFYPDHMTIALDPGIVVSGSELNGLRRNALTLLLEQRSAARKVITYPMDLSGKEPGRHVVSPRYRIRCGKLNQVFSAERVESFSLPLNELERMEGIIASHIWCELPDLVYPGEEEGIVARLLKLKNRGLMDAVAGNIGTVRLAAQAGLRVHGGYGLNVTNRIAAEAYANLGIADLTLSFEMPYPKMRDLASKTSLGCIIAGKLPLMQFRSCPARKDSGCGKCDGHPMITDRTGRSFRIECHERIYTTMLNSVMYYTADRPLPELDFYTLYLTDESPNEARDLFQLAVNREKSVSERTTGMSFRTLL